VLSYVQKWFRREGSGQTAKERLQLVLVHDRTALAPEVFEALKHDLMRVIAKYIEFDEEEIEVKLDRDMVALIASVPIREVKRQLRHANS